MKLKKLLCMLLVLVMAAGMLSSCSKKKDDDKEPDPPDEAVVLKDVPVMRDEKYDAVYIDITIDDFNEMGFAFGDSCDIVFSNGVEFRDVPYYNGYYVRTGLPVMVGYPGYPHVAVTLNSEGLWTSSGLKDGDTATVTLKQAGKYSAVQEALGQSYSNDRNTYPSDIAFANFRQLTGGSLRKDFLYRGASPSDNSKNRAPYANALIEANGVQFVLDLADTAEDFEGYMDKDGFTSDYTASLYKEGKVAVLGMSANYGSDAYKQKLASGLRQYISFGGPIYIHCTEGKDRTGFVCMLLEALSGASYDDMCADYMTTYVNYYGVTENGTPEKYAAIVDLYFDAFMSYLHGTEDINTLKNADYTDDAREYLISGGMTGEEVDRLLGIIAG